MVFVNSGFVKNMWWTRYRLTLWGDNAAKYDQENFEGKVVAIKSVMVTDWNGKSLSCTFGSTLDIDPDIPQAEDLKNHQVGFVLNLFWHILQRT